MRTIYGLSVDEKDESWSGIPVEIYNAITHSFSTMESAMDSAWKLLNEVDGILFVEVYVDTFCKHGIKREYIAFARYTYPKKWNVEINCKDKIRM